MLTVGNFDGVHRGHQRLIGRFRERADAAGVSGACRHVQPSSRGLLRPDKAPVPLVWTDREIALLEDAGATEVAVFRTGRWLLDLTAREFFDRVICRQFAARGMVEGPNFAFGHDRQGDVDTLSTGPPMPGSISKSSIRSKPTRPAHLLIANPPVALARGKFEEALELSRPSPSHPGRCDTWRRPGSGAGLSDDQH